MRFAEPLWLLIGAFAVVLLLILRVRSEYLTTRAIAALTGARLVPAGVLPSRFRRWLRVAVVSFATAMGFVALARPQKGMQWQTLDRTGTDLLLVVDTSKSMNADDVAPTRLERTKLAVRDLVERFPQDRIGLVAFAGDAYLESPMTLDHDALLDTLGAFDTSIISRGGTDIGHAIDIGAAALKSASGDQKVMVLLTDGEDLEGNGLEAAKRAADAGVTVDTVGVGTPAGELVPALNDQGVATGLVRDENGAPVRSHLDEAGLRAIAQAAHGTYRPLGADGRGLDRLYAESLASLSHTERSARVRRVYEEWFAVPLALSIFGIVFDALLGWRPRSRRTRRPPATSRVLRAAPLAVAAAMALIPANARASVQDAQKAYAAGRFDDAAREYDAERAAHPKDPRLAIDSGTAAYKAGHYDAAEADFQEALAAADPKLQQSVLYDLGDARYRTGASTVHDAPEKTIEQWKSAIASYEGALALVPNDADARFNRDFVKRKLAELENKQKQKPQDDKSKTKPDNGDSKKNQDGQKGDSKKDQAGAGDKGNSNGTSPGQNQAPDGTKPKDGSGQGSSQGQTPPGTKPSGNSANDTHPNPGNAANGPATGNGGKQNEPGQAGRDHQGEESRGATAAGGKLSPGDARALLQSLRGDERRVNFSGSAPPNADPPQKDW